MTQSDFPGVKNRVRLIRLFKKIYQSLKFRHHRQKTILFIIGCQRSGTTLLTERIFERDLDTRVYKEVSVLSRRNMPGTRLNPLRLVKSEIGRNSARLIILKPLVETQNAVRLLNYFEGSAAVWMYRHYKDAAASNLRHFGLRNGIDNLRPIIRNDIRSWRAEHVSPEVRKTVLKYFSETMNPHDAAALFWFVRNRFFFELGLDQRSDVMMCKYEHLVRNPHDTVRRIYEFAGHDFPGEKIVGEVHSASLGKGKAIPLSRDMEFLCEELFGKLSQAYEKQRTMRM